MTARVYLSGPISGMPEGNRSAFAEAREMLAAKPSVEIVSPFDLYEPAGPALHCAALRWCEAMVACLSALERCSYIYLLDGWQRSAGAWREYETALTLGVYVIFERAGRARRTA